MISEETTALLFPLIKRALGVGQTSSMNLDVHGADCQLSQGVHLIDQQTLIDRATLMKRHIWPDGRGTNLFAVKGQPNHWVLKTLHDQGFYFDCSSPTEVLDAVAVGAEHGQIMYTANSTPWSHLKFAMDNGAVLNLDDACYLDVLQEVPDTISFRVNIATLRKGSGQNSIIGKAESQKYGVPYEDIVAVFKKAKDMGVKKFGLHTMYASNNRSWQVHSETVEVLLGIAEKIKKEINVELDFINAGGGIGVNYMYPEDSSAVYGEDDKPFDIERYGQEINGRLSFFRDKALWRPKFFLECARYVAAPAGIWVAPIIAVTNKYRRFACMAACDGADLLRAGMYPAHHHVIILDENFQIVTDRQIIKQSIVGPLCENIHAVSERLLPEIRVGDYVVFCDTGCHGIEMGMNYNGWTKSAQVMRMIDGFLKLISRAQTIADIRALQIPLM